jgi:hypothetical protein
MIKYIKPISLVRTSSVYTNINNIKDVNTRHRLLSAHAITMLKDTKLTLASHA